MLRKGNHIENLFKLVFLPDWQNIITPSVHYFEQQNWIERKNKQIHNELLKCYCNWLTIDDVSNKIWKRVISLSFLVLFLLLCFMVFCLSSYCVLCAQCYQCLWIVHSWLPILFCLMFIYKREKKIIYYFPFRFQPSKTRTSFRWHIGTSYGNRTWIYKILLKSHA